MSKELVATPPSPDQIAPSTAGAFPSSVVSATLEAEFDSTKDQSLER